MDTFIKADIFFFISAVASIFLAVLFSIVLFYFIKAGRNLYLISEKLQKYFKDSEEFVSDLKERLEENLIFRLFFLSGRGKKRSARERETKK